jgi:hypothetical protein
MVLRFCGWVAMRRRLLFLGICAGVSIGASSAAAVTYDRRTTPQGDRFLVVRGDFSPDDRLEDFVLAVRDHDASFIAFDSHGGDLDSAMRLGRMLRILGKDTIQTRNMHCESACSLAFLGGVRRMAEPGSIGVHRVYFTEAYEGSRDEAVVDMQKSTAVILGYLRELGVEAELLEISYGYDRDDMRFLSSAEMARMRVTTEEFSYGIAALDPPPAEAAAVEGAAVEAPPSDVPQDVEAAARKLVEEIVAAHGLNASTAISRVTDSYAGNIEYYGRRSALVDVLRDKQSYFERWPQREYRIRHDSLSVLCGGSVCEVMGLYDWSVRNSDQSSGFAGLASFSYSVDVTNMQIVAERSEIVAR